MTPEHHEDRLCMWAVRTGKPILSIDYGKAPECECSIPHNVAACTASLCLIYETLLTSFEIHPQIPIRLR